LREEPHWHIDETRWEVFVEREGKAGHRWYLWVFQSASVLYYALDPSRSATVPGTVLEGVERGIISCDRHSAYKKFARLHPGIVLSFCWAHQRRDLLKVANEHPTLNAWARSPSRLKRRTVAFAE
jgi:transposase